MRIALKRYGFLTSIIVIPIILLLVFMNSDSNSIPRIEELAALSWELDKEIVQTLSFKLAKEQPLAGTSEKYLLLDNEGSPWLFKLHESPSGFYCKIETSVSRWGRMYGLNLPYVHGIKLSINDSLKQGTIQRMVPDVVTLHDFDVARLNPSQIDELLRQQVLDYFVDNYGTTGDNFLLSQKTGRIYGVDKDSAFDVDEKLMRQNGGMRRFTGEGIYFSIWDNYIKGELDIDIVPTLALIDLMGRISDQTASEIFGPILDESEEVTFDSMDALKDKKKRLIEEFTGFYEMVFGRRGEEFNMPSRINSKAYRRQVLAGLKSEIIDKVDYLRRLKTRTKNAQENIDVVSSEDAWLLIEDKIFDPYSKGAVLRREDYADATRTLKDLRDSLVNVAERLAVTIYILEVNELFLEADYNFADPILLSKLRVTLHPASINIDSLKDRYSKVIKKGIFKDTETEFYQAMTLARILQGEDDKSIFMP